MTESIHGYAVTDIRKQVYGASDIRMACYACTFPTIAHHAGFPCTCPPDARLDIPAWVVRAWLSARFRKPRDLPRKAFRHSFENRVPKKGVEPLVTKRDGCGKDKRHRRSERSSYPCTRKEHALVARPIRDEAEHIAEELAHARELDDLDACMDPQVDVLLWEDIRVADELLSHAGGTYDLEEHYRRQGMGMREAIAQVSLHLKRQGREFEEADRRREEREWVAMERRMVEYWDRVESMPVSHAPSEEDRLKPLSRLMRERKAVSMV